MSGVSATVTQKNTWLGKEMGHDKVVKSSQLASKPGSGSFQVPFLQAKNSGGIGGLSPKESWVRGTRASETWEA